MNLMGKIFTTLILILSIAFLVVAVMVGASHRNWKKAATDAKNRAANLQRQIDNAKSQSNKKQKVLSAERVARAYQISQLESQLSIARKNRDDTQAQLRDELVISQQRLQSLNEAERRLAELDKQVAQLKDQNSTLIDDLASKREEVVTKTNALYKAQGENASLEQLVSDLSEQVAVKTKVMDALGIRDDQLTAHIEPKVDGVVRGVRDNVIVISLGGDDGIRRDHIVDIYRSDQFVGKAKVLRAEHDLSTARILPEFQTANVREGDHVTTKL